MKELNYIKVKRVSKKYLDKDFNYYKISGTVNGIRAILISKRRMVIKEPKDSKTKIFLRLFDDTNKKAIILNNCKQLETVLPIKKITNVRHFYKLM